MSDHDDVPIDAAASDPSQGWRPATHGGDPPGAGAAAAAGPAVAEDAAGGRTDGAAPTAARGATPAAADDATAARQRATAATADPNGPAAEPWSDEDGWEPDAWDEEQHEPLAGRPRRRSLLRPLPLALGGVVLVAGGFIGGVQVQKGQADDAAGMPAGLRALAAAGGGAAAGGAPVAVPGGAAAGGGPGGAAAGGGPGGAAAGGGGAAAGGAAASGGAAGGATAGGPGAATATGGGGAAAGGTTIGQVANVRGSTLYVETSDGTTVAVRVGSTAKVQRLSHSSVGGVHPGDTVVVSGSARSDGSVRATDVQAAANGLSLGFGGLRSGAGASGAGGGTRNSGGDPVDQLFGGG